jgi:hypothetical protein
LFQKTKRQNNTVTLLAKAKIRKGLTAEDKEKWEKSSPAGW